MDGSAEHPECCVLHRFRESRMRVNGNADVLRRSPVLECEYNFLNQLGHICADHVAAEQLVSLRVGDEFHEASRLAYRASAAICGKREVSDAVLPSGLFHLMLRE